jgi:inosose dehydratase
MTNREVSRRTFLKHAGLAAAALAAGAAGRAQGEEKPMLHVATNEYPWGTFYAREGKNFGADPDAGLAAVKAAGLDGFEPLARDAAHAASLVPLVAKHGLAMRSLYVNSTLHEADAAEKSIAGVLAIAEKAKPAGTRIIVTNPSPIKWGGPDSKSDEQLRTQAKALEALGSRLKDIGMTLSYHYHEAELRNAAREFHHMLAGTDPALVTLCMDAHWTYRGSGNSAVAVMDVARLYGPRITELHLRQSAGGTWTEALGEGDIDYPALAAYLAGQGVKPHIVVEQAVEKGSPQTMDAVAAHKASAAYARKVFAAMAAG